MFHPKGPSLRELVKQGLSSTKEGYDLLAPKFDYTPFVTPRAVIDISMKILSFEARANSDGKNEGTFDYVVDICTGTGAAIEGLIPIVKKEIVGIDWSEPMLAEAKKKFAGVTKPEVRFVCKDIFDIQFLRGYDLITCFGALGHIERRRQKEFVNVVYSMLRPGGIFAFITAERARWYHPADWPYYIFDTVMRVRNFFIKPEFVMYYINFLLPDVMRLFTDGRWEEIGIAKPEINDKTIALRLVIIKKA